MAETISIRIVDDSPAKPAGDQSTVTQSSQPATEPSPRPMESAGYMQPNAAPIPMLPASLEMVRVVPKEQVEKAESQRGDMTIAQAEKIVPQQSQTQQPTTIPGKETVQNNVVQQQIVTTAATIKPAQVVGTLTPSPGVMGPNRAVKNPDDLKTMGADANGYPEKVGKLADASEIAAKSMSLLARGANNAGNMLVGMAGNDRIMPAQIIGGLKDAIAAPLKMLPGPMGAAVGAGSEVVDAILKIPDKLAAAFLKQAEKLAPMSGAIAVSQANANVRTLMADFREAEQMGESYGKLIDAQNKLDLTMREILLPLKRAVLDAIVRYVQFSADNAEKVSWVVRTMGNIMGGKTVLAAMFATAGKGVVDELSKTIRGEVDRILGKDRNQNNDRFNEFFQQMQAAQFSPNAFNG